MNEKVHKTNAFRPRLLIGAAALFAFILGSCASAPAPIDTPVPSTEPAAPPPAPTDTPVPPPTETVPVPPASPAPLELSSAGFEADQAIPVQYACHGENLSPPLAWSAPPAGTESFAMVMDDPDAVSVVGFTWVHWLLFDIPADVLTMPEGVPREDELQDGSRHGQNNSDRNAYDGPCPPSGQTHAYVFTLYALDTRVALEPGVSKEELLTAMEGHILAQAELVGLYTSP